ncbi:MAG: hypothetical protein ACRCU9_03190 [Iodobacter sp.]
MKSLIFFMLGLLMLPAWSQMPEQNLEVYSYIAPAALADLKPGLSRELEQYAAAELKQRRIMPVNNNAVYEGSSDAFRIDLRKNKKQLVLELSVRQGASVNNMLERWSAKKVFNKEEYGLADQHSLFSAIQTLLDQLQGNYNSPAYLHGHMLMD